MKTLKKFLKEIKLFLLGQNYETVTEETIEQIKETKDVKLNSKLANIEIGTVIWAKRLNFRLEAQNVEYKISPYLVIGNTDCDLICMRGTSFAPDEKRKRIYFNAGVIAYDKPSYFRLYNLEHIGNERYVNIFSFLSKEKFRELFFLSKRLNEQDLFDLLSANNNLYKLIKVGDVIKYYNKIMYVCSVEGEQLLCIPVKDYEITKSNVKFLINDLDFENALCITKNDRMELLSCVNANKTKIILENYKNIIENLRVQSLIHSEETYEEKEKIINEKEVIPIKKYK